MNFFSRRKLLNNIARATALAAPSVYAAQLSDAPLPHPQPRKLKVIVAGGHPGDPEYGCGGTIARYSDLGHEVVLLYLNRGNPAEKPSDQANGPPRGRGPKSLRHPQGASVICGANRWQSDR